MNPNTTPTDRPVCVDCGMPVIASEKRCPSCLSGLERSEEYPTYCHPCPEGGDPIPPFGVILSSRIRLCKKCNRLAANGVDLCHVCLGNLIIGEYDPSQPDPKIHCADCGDEIVSGALCDFCLAKSEQPQSYPPSIVRAATDAMKAAMIDSILLSVDNMTQQLGMMRNLLVGMKEADQ